MVKIDSLQKSINEIRETGLENAELMPQVENWCVHIIVEGSARGMVAQMQGLANNVSLTCPHAAYPSDWYRISLVAEEFIERNCLNCTFHQVRREPNYGQVVLAKLKKRDDEALNNEQLKISLAEKVKQEAKDLINTETKNANPTQLSILKMVTKLGEESERVAIANKLSAAAKLDPAFFSNAALDVLFMYFEDEHAGNDCINAACSAMAGRNYFPIKAFELAKQQMKGSPHFDQLAKILGLFIDANNIKDHRSTLIALIDRLWYKRFIGEPFDPIRNFQNAESLLISLGTSAPQLLIEIFREQLAINDKNKRININLLLQRLTEALPDIVAGLTVPILKSLELVDDQYEQSADQTTLDTLHGIIKLFPLETFQILTDERTKLSIDARTTLIKLTIKLLSDRAFTDSQPVITDTLVDELMANIFNKGIPEKTREEATHQLSYFISHRPELFQSRFDGFLGYLSEIAKEEALFKYYRDEFDNKPPQGYTTFNYLIGKDFWEIKGIEQQIHSRYNEIKKILGQLCKAAPEQNLPKIYSLIPQIDSIKDEKYKQELLSIVTDYGKDPVTISGFIPQLYKHLLDPDSINIRYSALKYFDLLIDRFPMLVTSSLWDLFDVFIRDKNVIVHGMALTILGTTANKFPEKVSADYIQLYREALFNPKVFVHSRAIDISSDLRPFMDRNQQYDVIGLLLQLAEIYKKEDDETIFSAIVDQLLYFAADQPKFIYSIAEKYIFPQTASDDYYKAKEQIERLGHLLKRSGKIEHLWLKSVLSFLTRFPYDGGSQDDRLDFYYKIYHLRQDVIIDQAMLFRELTMLHRTAIQTHFDIAQVLDLLGYFEQYELINEIGTALKIQYPEVEANKRLLKFIDFWNFLAESEIASDHNKKLKNLKSAENVF